MARATRAREQGEDPKAALEPLFHKELAAHPDEEDLLLELWDQLISRQVL